MTEDIIKQMTEFQSDWTQIRRWVTVYLVCYVFSKTVSLLCTGTKHNFLWVSEIQMKQWHTIRILMYFIYKCLKKDHTTYILNRLWKRCAVASCIIKIRLAGAVYRLINLLFNSFTAKFKNVVWDYFHVQYYTSF